MPNTPRPPEPDRDHVLTEQDAAIAGFDLKAEIAKAAWEPVPHEIPVELTPEYEAVPYAPPTPTFFPPLAGRLDEAMQTRLRDLYGAL